MILIVVQYGYTQKRLLIATDTIVKYSFDTLPPPGGYRYEYNNDSNIVTAFRPYFVNDICQPGDLNNPIYIRYMKTAADVAHTIRDTVLKLISYDTSCRKLFNNQSDFFDISLQPVPVYFLAPNVSMYRSGEPIRKYFSLDTTGYLYMVKCGYKAVLPLYKNKSGITIISPQKDFYRIAHSYGYIADSSHNKPIGYMISISPPGQFSFSGIRLGYIKNNNQQNIVTYYTGGDAVYINGKHVRDTYNKYYLIRSLDKYYENVSQFDNAYTSLKNRIRDFYFNKFIRENIREVLQRQNAGKYLFSVNGMVLDKAFGSSGMVDRINIFDSVERRITQSIQTYNEDVTGLLKDFVEVYDFNFDGYPDIFYSSQAATRDISLKSNHIYNIALYDSLSKNFLFNEIGLKRYTFFDYNYNTRHISEYHRIRSELTADTLQKSVSNDFRFRINVYNDSDKPVSIANPLDALTLRLSEKDSGYNIILPYTSRLLSKDTTSSFRNIAFTLDSVQLNGNRLSADSIANMQVRLLPKGRYTYFLRIKNVIGNRDDAVKHTATNPVQLPPGDYHLLAVLAVIQGNERHVLMIDPLLVHYR